MNITNFYEDSPHITWPKKNAVDSLGGLFLSFLWEKSIFLINWVRRAVSKCNVPELASRGFPESKTDPMKLSSFDGKMLFRLFNCSNTIEQEYNGFQTIYILK